jgi:hypothetical protein
VEGEEGLLDQSACSVVNVSGEGQIRFERILVRINSGPATATYGCQSFLFQNLDLVARSARRFRSGASSLQPWAYCNVLREFRTPSKAGRPPHRHRNQHSPHSGRHSDASVHMAGRMLKDLRIQW